jgi:hypothetical protein
MKVLLLGARRGLGENRWKDDIAEAGELLGWEVDHLNARDVEAEDVTRQAKGCDLLLWARTHGHDPHGDVAGMLRRIEDMGVATVALHLDLYWGIGHREAQIGRHPWWSCQHVFTADGGPRNWAGRGVNHHWCPPPMGHRFFGRGQEMRRFSHAAAFVGSSSRTIHGDHRRRLLSWARRRWHGRFRHYAGGRHGVWGSALSDLYTSAGVVVGDSAPASHYWSDRVPCTLGRGGFLIHPRTPGMAEQGFDEQVMVLFDRYDFRDLGRRLDAVTPRRRRELTDNALTLISERHMWSHRLLEIERIICG